MEVVFPAECTVEFMEEIKASLLVALDGNTPIALSFGQVERVDLSFFQLLHVAEKRFRELGRQVVFTADLSPSFAFKATVTQWSRLLPADSQEVSSRV